MRASLFGIAVIALAAAASFASIPASAYGQSDVQRLSVVSVTGNDATTAPLAAPVLFAENAVDEHLTGSVAAATPRGAYQGATTTGFQAAVFVSTRRARPGGGAAGERMTT